MTLLERAKAFLERYTLDIDMSCPVAVEPSEPDDLLLTYDCKLMLTGNEPDDPDDPAQIGAIEAYYAQFSLAQSGDVGQFSRWEILDHPNMDTAEYISLFANPDMNADDDEDDRWSKAVTDQVETVFCSDLIILNRCEVNPEYRGHGIGLMAVRRLLHTLCKGNEVLVAYHPGPPEVKHTDPDYAPAAEKLKFYWSRLGSKPVKGTELWVLSSMEQWPSFEQMLSEIPARKPSGKEKMRRALV
jgi:hypothetical protein